MQPAPDSTSSTGHTFVRFDLDLSKALSYFIEDYSDYNSGSPFSCFSQWSQLPSSLSVTSFLASDPYGSLQRLAARASYTVQADLFRHGKSVSCVSRDIRIFGDEKPQPPTCLGDFSSDYVCEQKCALRRHIVYRIGVFSVTIAEPEPFLFCSGKDFAMTRLSVHFDLQGPPNPNSGAGSYTTSVVWQLRTSTFVSVQPMIVAPTVRQAHRCRFISLSTTLGLKHWLKLAGGCWQPATAACGAAEAWSIDQKIALAIPTRCLLPPTFITPHIARRYSLLVRVKIAGSGTARVRLEVPVQIVYVKGTGPPGGQSEIVGAEPDSEAQRILGADAVDELPAYVP